MKNQDLMKRIHQENKDFDNKRRADLKEFQKKIEASSLEFKKELEKSEAEMDKLVSDYKEKIKSPFSYKNEGKNIKKLREYLFLSRPELARLFFVTERTVKSWECDERLMPTFYFVRLLCVSIESHKDTLPPSEIEKLFHRVKGNAL